NGSPLELDRRYEIQCFGRKNLVAGGYRYIVAALGQGACRGLIVAMVQHDSEPSQSFGEHGTLTTFICVLDRCLVSLDRLVDVTRTLTLPREREKIARTAGPHFRAPNQPYGRSSCVTGGETI